MTKVGVKSVKQHKFLFFGELPPAVVHGVSISNKINTDILRELGELTIIEEKWDLSVHDRFSIKKVFSVLKSAIQIWSAAGKKRYDLYYSVLSISIFGALKQLLALIAFKLRNRDACLLFHVHRSDLKTIAEENYLFRLFILLLNKLEARFILLSETHKEECDKVLYKTFVLYNCIDEREVYPLKSKRDNDKIIFLYLSNYIKEKGILDLLRAFNLTKLTFRAELICYGGFTDKKIKKEIDEIASKSDNIIIYDTVYGTEKNRVLNSADVVILPSYNEGLPLVIIEALRLNKPVIVTKVGYIAELLGDQYPLYCKAGDVHSINQAIKKANSIIEFESFSEKIREVYSKVSFEKHKDKLKEIVMDVLYVPSKS